MREHGRIVAIVQARMASTRFPGKVLELIGPHPVLWHVVQRTKVAQHVDTVVVATSDRASDDPIAQFCEGIDVTCYRGSEGDVLDRYYRAAQFLDAGVVVRITGDCPFIDPAVVDRVVRTYLEGDDDYVSNTLRHTFPDGLDTEAFSFAALESAWRDARLWIEREHVTPYIRTSGRFAVANVVHDLDLSVRELRWTIDDPSDLEFIRAVYARLEETEGVFLMQDVLRVLEEAPKLVKINAGQIRNEGYYRSLLEEPILPASDLVFDRSNQLRARAERVIPSCTQTFSKGPMQFVQGASPVFLSHGRGSHVWDVDGNDYIDLINALGPVVLGYDYPTVTETASQQLRAGVSLSLPTELEVELAEMLVSLIPCAEMVRFGKNGSDATSGAVRVARAWTGRDVIACCGYHGWHDWYIGTTSRNAGVPEAVSGLTAPFEYNDIESLERIFMDRGGEVAAVVMEPVGVVEPKLGFLEAVRDITRREGALLIFDEVVTGFRVALGGAQSYFGITPDLACFGKAIANGFPLSAVVGRADVMELFDEVFFSFTFGGEAVSLAAAVATIQEMQDRDVIEHLWEQGTKLQDGYNVMANELGLRHVTQCVGLPPHTVMEFRDADGIRALLLRSLFQQEVVNRGVLFLVGVTPSYSHTDADVDQTLRAFRAALETTAGALESGEPAGWLKGELARPVFRQA